MLKTAKDYRLYVNLPCNGVQQIIDDFSRSVKACP